MKLITKILIGVGGLISITMNETFSLHAAPPLEMIMKAKNLVDELRYNLPYDCQNGVVMTSAEYDSSNYSLIYSHYFKIPIDLPTEETICEIKQGLIDLLKANPDGEDMKFLESGFRFRYKFFNPDGELVYVLEISPEDLITYGNTIDVPTYTPPTPNPAPGLDRAAKQRYNEMFEAHHSSIDFYNWYEDGRRIWYTPYCIDNLRAPNGYDNYLLIYDSVTDNTQRISLNKTSLEDDDMYIEDAAVDDDGVLTLIMTERRNSNGWIEGTYVWQYDCKDGMWTPLALECAGAEFVSNYKAVKITHATVLNPDAPTYLQEYRYSHQMINL